jgi:uncharacterized protein
MANSNNLYPIFLKLETLQVLLVGAGNVGLEKLTSILTNSPLAAVTIIAPLIKPEIRILIKDFPNCKIIERAFLETDLECKQLVLCATDDNALHLQIKLLANSKGLLVNVADKPELCDFYLGSIVQKGDLKIAISTNGKSPTIAKRIKEVLHETIPEEIDDLLGAMQKIRNKMSGDFTEKVKALNEITKKLSVK